MARNKKQGDKYNAPFAMSLRRMLEKMGTTQGELAAHIGVTPQTVSQYCNGTSEPSFDNLVKIADWLNVSTDYLLGRTNDPERQVSAVDDLGLSEDVIQGIKRLRLDDEIDFENAVSGRGTCGAFNSLISSTLKDGMIYAKIALLTRRIEKLSNANIPESLKPHDSLTQRLGAAAIDISASAKLDYELYEKYPELAGLFHVQFGEKCLQIDLADICDGLRDCIEDISGYKAFVEGRARHQGTII